MPPATVPPLAYSYIRFSHPDQARGDSLRRQTEAAADWCKRHGVRLDTALTFRDLGRSAYLGEHRKNPDRHALAAFLKLAEGGQVPAGSYLVIENLDRLTREDVWSALDLVISLLKSGIKIVQLSPAEQVIDKASGPMVAMMALMELSRGHGESARKSEMIGAVWAKFRQNPGRGRRTPGRLPAWVEARPDGTLALIPEKATAVARVFELAASGYGMTRIIQRLEAEGVRPLGPSGRWVRAYVGLILRDRRAVGEYQPCQGSGRDNRPCGEPIPGFFPAAITEEQWLAARSGTSQRQRRPGRIGRRLHLFGGLMFCARTHTPLYAEGRLLKSVASVEGRARRHSFPRETFECAVLSALKEIDPREVLGQTSRPDEVMRLSGELAWIEAKIAELEAELLNGEVATAVRVLRRLEAQRAERNSQLIEARQAAASPLSEAWGNVKSLLTILEHAPDPEDTRLRLRSALRRILASAWVLAIPRGQERLAAVQLYFAGGAQRSYVVLHRPPKGNAAGRNDPGGWMVRSFADVSIPAHLDLRKSAHARTVEAGLSTAWERAARHFS
jgi:DNA invertase Pin-like site-specific DNA recombinase